MKYLRTTMATNWSPDKTLLDTVVEKLLFFIPKSNPDYENKLHLVREWLIEFDEDDLPNREVALDQDGKFVLCGPNSTNYGFWLDASMKFQDFKGTVCTPEYFKSMWRATW